MNYISYDDYKILGGKCDEDTFPTLQFRIETKLNYITFGNINLFLNSLNEVPECVKRLEVEAINLLYAEKIQQVNDKITSYSNGIETFGYDSSKSSDEVLTTNVKKLAQEYLYEYPELFYRGRWLYKC